MEGFDQPHFFQSVSCPIYGKLEQISLFHQRLLGKPLGIQLLFVWAKTSRGRIVLRCSRQDQDPIQAIELYCARIRIEGMFDRLKHFIGAFSFRFGALSQKKQSRTPMKNQKVRKLSKKQKLKVEQGWKAMEGDANCGAMALGILQMIAIQFQHRVWKHHRMFLLRNKFMLFTDIS